MTFGEVLEWLFGIDKLKDKKVQKNLELARINEARINGLNNPDIREDKAQQELEEGEEGEITFNYNYKRIDYVCKIHRIEVNSITIFTADDYKNMSNIQRLRYLNNIYNIRTPNLLNFLNENK